MAQHRYRQNKVKREHSIIEGLLPTLERIASLPGVHGVTPGRIRPRSRPGPPGIRLQYLTETGFKLLARSNTAVQEVFVVANEPGPVIDRLRGAGILQGDGNDSVPARRGGRNADRSRSAERSENAEHRRETGPAEASPAGTPEAEPLDEELANAEHAKPGLQRTRTTRPKKAGPRKPRIRRKSEEPRQPASSIWNEILERHEQLLELEQRLGLS